MPERCILLVEDNADHEALALRALRKCNLTREVVVARDGIQALDYLAGIADHQALPGLVLLDLNLPNLGGLEVLRRVRAEERTARLPVIVLTSSDEESDITTSYGLGASSYVLKPLDYCRFVEVTRQLGLDWLHA